MQQQQPIAIASPNVYIDVWLNGQKTVYSVETAQALYEQLGVALNALDQAAQTDQGTQETGSQNQSPSPDGPVPIVGDAEPPAEGEEIPPAA